MREGGRSMEVQDRLASRRECVDRTICDWLRGHKRYGTEYSKEDEALEQVPQVPPVPQVP